MRWRALLALVTMVWAAPAASTQTAGCEPDGKVRFICGMPSPEDLVAVPGGEWVIASGYIRGGVHLINTRTFATTQVFPTVTPRERFDAARFAACPGPVDPGQKEKLSAHGLALAAGPE